MEKQEFTKTILGEYAEAKAQMKYWADKESQLKPAITAFMIQEDADKIDSEFGTFSLAKRKSWAYPQPIVEMEADLKVAKKTAEAKGDATYEEKPYFVFKEPKVVEEE